MPIEFKWEKYNPHRRRVFEPVEVNDGFRVVLQNKHGRRKTITNDLVAFEIISRGKLYDQLLLAYELRQRQQAPKIEVQKVEEKPTPPTPIAPVIEAIEQVAEIVDVTPTIKQAETQEADYKLSPDDWFECVIERVSRRNLILQLENATATCVPGEVSDSPGSHNMGCLVGLVGAVRLEIVGGVYRALELQVLGEPTTLREEARVTWRDPGLNICKAERPCGCPILIGGIADEGVYGEVSTGDFISFDLERSRSRGNWIGTRARKISAPLAQGEKVNGNNDDRKNGADGTRE